VHSQIEGQIGYRAQFSRLSQFKPGVDAIALLFKACSNLAFSFCPDPHLRCISRTHARRAVQPPAEGCRLGLVHRLIVGGLQGFIFE
jgi:hypothetical protein